MLPHLIKGYQLKDDSLPLEKISGGIKILDSNNAILGSNRSGTDFLQPNEFVNYTYFYENTKDYFTINQPNFGYTTNIGYVVDGDSYLVAISKLQSQLNIFISGTSGIYSINGYTDGIVNLTTNDIPESGTNNLYFTIQRVRDSIYANTPIVFDSTSGIISIDSGYHIPTTAEFNDFSATAKFINSTSGYFEYINNKGIANGYVPLDNNTLIDPIYLNLTSNIIGINYTSGNFSLYAGYAIPLIADISNGNTAFGWGNHSTQGYAIGTGSVNRVAYWTATNTLASSPNYTWDNSTSQLNIDGKLGINSLNTINGIVEGLHIYSNNSRFEHSDDTENPNIYFVRGRGNNNANSALLNNDIIGRIAGRGVYTNGLISDDVTAIDFIATNNYTLNGYGSKISFKTTPSGTSGLIERLVIKDNGIVNISNLSNAGTNAKSVQVSSTGDLEIGGDIFDTFITDPTTIANLTNNFNWNNSVYIGPGLVGLYKNQFYYDNSYLFMMVSNTIPKRVPII